MFTHGQSVTVFVRTKTGEDGDGNDVYDAVPTVVDGVAFWPAGATESVQGQDLTTSGATAMLPAGTDVDAIDYLLGPDGVTYEVNGIPDVYHSPFTGLDPGVFVTLQRVF